MEILQNEQTYFITGSVVLISVSLIAMLIHKKIDNYSLKHDRLSYAGVRNNFKHPIRKTNYQKNSFPEILNFSIYFPGIMYMIGFWMLDNIFVKIIGLIFSVLVVIIGMIDVSTHYYLHNSSVILSQPVFMVLMISILVSQFNVITLITLVAILFLVAINIYQKQRQNRDPDFDANVIPQKLFIYLEATYIMFISDFLR